MLNILNNIFAFPCPGCKSATGIGEKNCFCEECLGRLPLVGTRTCPGCGGDLDGIFEVCANCLREEKRPWGKAVALMRFEGFGQELIHNFKYRNHPELARPLGIMAGQVVQKQKVLADYLVPMPLHWCRYLIRGFNQAELLCRMVSRDTGIPVKKILKRSRWTRQQAKLSREERRKNIIDAFFVKKEDICKNSNILLVDDVLTTGATLSEATKVLLDAGAREVNILVLARGY